MKRALITGITGQDGYYLTKFLADKGYEIFGLVRRSSHNPFLRFERDIPLWRKINVIYGNMRDVESLRRALEVSKPDEIYNLAALSDVGISFQCPAETLEINYHGVGKLITEAERMFPESRFYQASTSEMFGRTNPPQNEKSIFLPVSPYAEAKLRAHEDYVRGYRGKYGYFSCSGILFNHESPKRGENFVTRKVILSLAKVKVGLQDYLELGNMDAKRDWGFAGDFVEAMWMILQQDKPDDYVISTGENHTVREFVNTAAEFLGFKLSWEGSAEQEVAKDQNGRIIVKINPKFYRPNEVHNLLGDSAKARKILGWAPKTSFKDLVKMMVESDLKIAESLKE
jgi:GDPmannose 4,6-dehydratase